MNCLARERTAGSERAKSASSVKLPHECHKFLVTRRAPQLGQIDNGRVRAGTRRVYCRLISVAEESHHEHTLGRCRASRAKNEEANRNLASIRPSFIVKDLQTSITYYRERLGFQLDFQGPDDDPFWAGVSRDGIGIMLKAVAPDVLPCPNHTRHEWAPPDANIYSMDPDALFDEFSRRGASYV